MGFRNSCKLLFPCQIVANVMVEDAGFARMLSLLDEQGYGNRGAGSALKDIPGFLLPQLSLCARITSQIIHMNGSKLFFQHMPETVSRITIYPIAVGNEADNPLIANAIRCPSKCSYIRVI